MSYLKITPRVEKSAVEELQFGNIIFHTDGVDMTIQTEKVLETKDGNATELKLPKQFIYAELDLSRVREIHAFLGAYIAHEEHGEIQAIRDTTEVGLISLETTIKESLSSLGYAINNQ
jgi:hypothetical protein